MSRTAITIESLKTIGFVPNLRMPGNDGWDRCDMSRLMHAEKGGYVHVRLMQSQKGGPFELVEFNTFRYEMEGSGYSLPPIYQPQLLEDVVALVGRIEKCYGLTIKKEAPNAAETK